MAKISKGGSNMTCIRTGCHAFLAQYDLYAYGDAHQFGPVLLLRLCQEDFVPIGPVLHFQVATIDDWFNRHGSENSTLVSTDFVYLGYDGIPVLGAPSCPDSS